MTDIFGGTRPTVPTVPDAPPAGGGEGEAPIPQVAQPQVPQPQVPQPQTPQTPQPQVPQPQVPQPGPWVSDRTLWQPTGGLQASMNGAVATDPSQVSGPVDPSQVHAPMNGAVPLSEPAAPSGPVAPVSEPAASSGPVTPMNGAVAPEPDYKALYEQQQRELEQQRLEAARQQALLAEQQREAYWRAEHQKLLKRIQDLPADEGQRLLDQFHTMRQLDMRLRYEQQQRALAQQMQEQQERLLQTAARAYYAPYAQEVGQALGVQLTPEELSECVQIAETASPDAIASHIQTAILPRRQLQAQIEQLRRSQQVQQRQALGVYAQGGSGAAIGGITPPPSRRGLSTEEAAAILAGRA